MFFERLAITFLAMCALGIFGLLLSCRFMPPRRPYRNYRVGSVHK